MDNWTAPDYRPAKDRPLDRALLVADDERVHVLAHIGPDLDAAWTANEGDLSDLFGNAEFGPGVWIWEGRVEATEHAIEFPQRGTTTTRVPVGHFRSLTDDEWTGMKQGGPMWDPNKWFMPSEGAFVVKLQLSMVSSDGERRLLAYNEDRSVTHETTLSGDAAEEVETLLRGQPKGYFEARLDADGLLDIGPPVPDPGW